MNVSLIRGIKLAILDFVSRLLPKSLWVLAIAFFISIDAGAESLYLIDTDCKLVGASFGSDELTVVSGERHIRVCEQISGRLSCGFYGDGKREILKSRGSSKSVKVLSSDTGRFNLNLKLDSAEYRYSVIQFDERSNSLISKSCAGQVLTSAEWGKLVGKNEGQLIAGSK